MDSSNGNVAMGPPASPRPRKKYSPFSAFESGAGSGVGMQPDAQLSHNSPPAVPSKSKPPVSARAGEGTGMGGMSGMGPPKRRSTLSFEIGGADAADGETATDTDDVHATPTLLAVPVPAPPSPSLNPRPSNPPYARSRANVNANERENFSSGAATARHPQQQQQQARAETTLPNPNTAALPPGAMPPSRHHLRQQQQQQQQQGYTNTNTSTSTPIEVYGGQEAQAESEEPLAPPRPRFLAEAAGARSSWSSQDSSLFDSSSSSAAPSEDENANTPKPTAVDSSLPASASAPRGPMQSQTSPFHRRRSGQFSSTSSSRAGAGPGATGPGAVGGGGPGPQQQNQNQNQNQSQRTAYNAPRRFSNSHSHRRASLDLANANANTNAHRKASGSVEDATALGVPAAAGAGVGGVSASAVAGAAGAGAGAGMMGMGIRSPSPSAAVAAGRPLSGVGIPPPSAFRNSRSATMPVSSSSSNAANANGNGAPLGVGEEHPLSPNANAALFANGGYLPPQSQSQSNSPTTDEFNDTGDAYGGFYGGYNYGGGYGGNAASSIGHGSVLSSYPPSSPGLASPGPGAQPQPQGALAQGQQPNSGPNPVYPGGVNAQGAGYPYPYPYPAPGAATGRPTHAFMANSAIARSSFSSSASELVPYAARLNGLNAVGTATGMGMGMGNLPPGLPPTAYIGDDLSPPQPPFAGYPPPSPTGTPGPPDSPQTLQLRLRPSASQTRLREPFLSPASRRTSSVWAPPTPAMYGPAPATPGTAGVGFVEGGVGAGTGAGGSGFFNGAGGYAYNGVGNGSTTMLALPGKKEPLPSSALKRKISVSEKPWIKKKDKLERASWWVTFCIIWIGVAVGGVVCYFGYSNVEKIDQSLCSVLSDSFSTLDTDTWTYNVSLGGFGNGEFEMTTDSTDNIYIKNNELYIMPTLTSDEIGTDAIFDGTTYNLTDCTETWNATDCSVTSDNSTSTVINPVKSARISTKNSVSIAYGKVEVVAKLPQGDWLWPAIWMLPTDEKYGAWPMSGEIDIMEARGNDNTYPEQGDNYVRSSLRWGPLSGVLASAYGWRDLKRTNYAAAFHTYTFEWTSTFMRISVDSKLKTMIDLSLKKESFWTRGKFPSTSQNGSTEAVVENIWEGQPNSAPFDQDFYLIINLAVGGTSGWFPDNEGGKMWYDGSATAMTDFAKEQDTWYATWPSSDDDRAFRIKSVNMWSLC